MRISDWSSDVCSSDLQAIQNVTVPKDEVVEIPVIGSDADGNPLILSLMNESPFRPVPGFITLTDNGDGTGVIRIAPGANDRGNYSILAVATDDGDGLGDPISGGYLFNIEVVSENEAPVIAHIGDAVAVVGQPLTALVLVSDMDEDALSYLVTGLPGATLTPTSVYGQALLEWTPTAAQIGSYRSEEHTSELQSLMRNSYAVFCLKKKTIKITT